MHRRFLPLREYLASYRAQACPIDSPLFKDYLSSADKGNKDHKQL